MNVILYANTLPGKVAYTGLKRGDTAQAFTDPDKKQGSQGLVKLLKPSAKKMYIRNMLTGYTRCYEEWECWSYTFKKRINYRFVYEVNILTGSPERATINN